VVQSRQCQGKSVLDDDLLGTSGARSFRSHVPLERTTTYLRRTPVVVVVVFAAAVDDRGALLEASVFASFPLFDLVGREYRSGGMLSVAVAVAVAVADDCHIVASADALAPLCVLVKW